MIWFVIGLGLLVVACLGALYMLAKVIQQVFDP